MGLNDIFHRFKTLAVISSLGILALFLLGAAPHQGGVPPQPYGANFFSGLVKVQGEIPPVGTKIIGCVASCAEIFESEPALTDADGNYVALKLNPDDEGLVGRIITFYVVNEFGRTVANETRRFEGDFNIYPLDLAFAGPIPVYTAPAVIPITLTVVPKIGLVTTVNGTGFASNSMVTVTSEGMTLGTAPTDDLGSFRLIVTAPSSISGAYEITSIDSEGTSTNATLTVPDFSGPIGEMGMPGETGALGEQGLTGEDASIVLGVVALSLAGLGILIIVVIYLYLISWFNDLARRLPPPGIR